MLRFNILGPLDVTDDEGHVVPIPAGRARTVLGLLCAAPGQVISRERLIDAAWEGAAPASAVTRLHSMISDLRRAIPDAPILTSGGGYVLAVADDGTDLGAARLLAARARSARDRGEPEPAASCLGDALGMWRGRAFDGIACAELEAEAERIALEHAGLLEEHAELALVVGHHAAVAADLSGWVTHHPLREGMRASLMRALARSGRQADAIATYHDLRRRLDEELGVAPSPHLQDLYHAILNGDRAVMSSQAGPGARIRARQLPAGVSDFTGRTAELALLSGLLKGRADSRIAPVVAVISGLGGIGKSALAVHASQLAAEFFPDGQLFVNLASTSGDPAEPTDVLASLLRDLGVPAADVPAREAERAARYRSLLAGREVLVVLDDARNEAQVRSLLPGSPGCAVLITSRNKLIGTPGSVPVDLDALPPDEGLDLFSRIIGGARAAGEPAAAERVISACAGLPLAIRIAAAKLAARPGWTIARAADRLEEAQSRLTELRAGDLAVAASFKLSYDALPPPTARAFRLLGLSAPGQFCSGAAAALFGMRQSKAEELMEALVDSNLLETREQDQYRLHDLLRLFAGELASGEIKPDDREAAIRLLTWYATGLQAAAQALGAGRNLPDCLPDSAFGGHPAPQFGSYQAALTWCDREFTALIWAITAAASHERHDVVVAIACLLWFYARLTPVPDSYAAALRRGLLSARALGNDDAEQRLLASLGGILMWRGEHDAALSTLLTALQVARRATVPKRVAAALDNVGAALHSQGLFDEALKFQLQAVALHRRGPEPGQLATALSNLGGTHYEMGSHEHAIGCFLEAIELTRETGFKHGEAIARTGLGETYRLLGRPADAMEEHTIALSLHRELGSGHRSVIGALDKLAEARAAMGAVDDAREAWAEAVRIADAFGDRRAAALRDRLGSL